jgi:hypothetical protein
MPSRRVSVHRLGSHPINSTSSTRSSRAPSSPAPPSLLPTNQPVLQLSVGANLGVTKAAVAVGLGPHSCIGVSLGGSSTCASAPTTATLSVAIGTPLGTLSL